MASPEFSTAEWRTLDDVLSLLRSPQPWFASVPAGRLCAACPKRSPHLSPPDLLAVSGNWYDVLHKAPVLARLAAAAPSADLFLAGGRRERLTSAEAAAEGGEPLLLGRTLAVLGVARSRLVVWSGSRVTNHNLRALLHYAKQRREFEPAAPPLRVALVEEGFLRRSRGCWRRTTRRSALSALVLGELDRPAVRHGALLPAEALDALGAPLRQATRALRERHAASLGEGRRILERAPRGEMLALATPRGGERSRDT
ncbi:hypothetical protein EMIHUDRAFT_108728 [Emiliania huxleyi CCMP1516]|uniref:Uncharacterized protein n=2 Tax=Emiliania huxleyi TaxID=2903 RepID=A0A0D3KW28_EMIH1|nr:hypothetical protein EMIHUDRAFT_108728 [Emiliania huxleyi CCMP1516]EOD39963.1 hypothetical protein EMIHUDRAFT_108728 [Emiliania huxleyi CCMP1516]|eukprot:XP_005792392.1 hypothetical protein EMIHUDRAFT_108728 [Emiliania huxleyi CCMP1516]